MGRLLAVLPVLIVLWGLGSLLWSVVRLRRKVAALRAHRDELRTDLMYVDQQLHYLIQNPLTDTGTKGELELVRSDIANHIPPMKMLRKDRP